MPPRGLAMSILGARYPRAEGSLLPRLDSSSSLRLLSAAAHLRDDAKKETKKSIDKCKYKHRFIINKFDSCEREFCEKHQSLNNKAICKDCEKTFNNYQNKNAMLLVGIVSVIIMIISSISFASANQ